MTRRFLYSLEGLENDKMMKSFLLLAGEIEVTRKKYPIPTYLNENKWAAAFSGTSPVYHCLMIRDF